jgi:hypothetical protein
MFAGSAVVVDTYSADPTTLEQIDGRWKLLYTSRPGTASPIQVSGGMCIAVCQQSPSSASVAAGMVAKADEAVGKALND